MKKMKKGRENGVLTVVEEAGHRKTMQGSEDGVKEDSDDGK